MGGVGELGGGGTVGVGGIIHRSLPPPPTEMCLLLYSTFRKFIYIKVKFYIVIT